MSDVRDHLLEHLRFLGELGVDGLSRDASWRVRTERPPAAAEADAAASAAATPLVPVTGPAASEEAVAAAAAASIGADEAAALLALQQAIGPCTRCKLSRLGRSQVVFGAGSATARLMFVGEGPGHDEDVQGVPFVGRAGQLLTKMIEAIELTREQVYIANVVKCRPPDNRNPEPDEIASCEPFLLRQIAIIQPKVIVALGKFATQTLLGSTAPISKLRGNVYSYRGARLVPTFHPAFLLRSPNYKREAWDDLKKVRALLAEG